MHECGFSRARRTHDGDELPLLDLEIDIEEHSGFEPRIGKIGLGEGRRLNEW